MSAYKNIMFYYLYTRLDLDLNLHHFFLFIASIDLYGDPYTRIPYESTSTRNIRGNSASALEEHYPALVPGKCLEYEVPRTSKSTRTSTRYLVPGTRILVLVLPRSLVCSTV